MLMQLYRSVHYLLRAKKLKERLKIVQLVFIIKKSSITKIWVRALLFQVFSKCEAISEFGVRTVKGETKGAVSKN